MYHGKTISLIFPAFNEEPNIVQAVKDFSRLRIIDEILVVDNNSRDRTAVLAQRAGATVIRQRHQGYGWAIRKGLQKAKGEYILLAEPDGTFRSSDLKRLLRPLDNNDCVFGTRTNPLYISPGANMRWALRNGNLIVAKCMQVLFSTSSLTDCGCTFRVMKRQVVTAILPHLTVGGSYLLPQIVIQTAIHGYTFVELPVHYGRRVGVSKITGSMRKSAFVGLAMMYLIFESWIQERVMYK